MKVVAIFAIAALCVALAAPAAQAATLKAYLDNVCPEVLTPLGERGQLWASVSAIGNDTIEIPPGTTPVLFAPSNEAFAVALQRLGYTDSEFLAAPDLVRSVVAVHLGVNAKNSTSKVDTLAGKNIDLMSGGGPVPLSEFVTSYIDDPRQAMLLSTETIANVENSVRCPGENGFLVVFTDTVFLPESVGPLAPVSGPTVAPTGPRVMSVGEMVRGLCSNVRNTIAMPDYSTAFELLTRPDVAAATVTLPPGEVVIVAPNNDAFAEFLKTTDPAILNSTADVVAILANHVGVVKNPDNVVPADALSGESINFWRKDGGLIQISALDLRNNTNDAQISTGEATAEGAVGAANVFAAADCPGESIAFTVDKVLLPASFVAPPVPAPTAAPLPAAAPLPVAAPLPAVAPLPAPIVPVGPVVPDPVVPAPVVPASGSAAATVTVAAAVAAVLAVMA